MRSTPKVVRGEVTLRGVRVAKHLNGIAAEARIAPGKTPAVTVELRRGRRVLADHGLGLVDPSGRRTVLQVDRKLPPPGSYAVVLLADGREVTQEPIKIR